MKKIVFGVLPLLVMGNLLLNGCVSHQCTVHATAEPVTARTVVVTETPPRAQSEVVASAPSETEVWIKGYWMFTDRRWVWMPGHWESRPRVNAVWMPGHWDVAADGKSWAWAQGYWL